MQQSIQPNMIDVTAEGYYSKIMNIIREVMSEPEKNLAEYQAVMSEMLKTLKLGEGVQILERISTEIKGLAQYRTFLRMFKSGILFGKTFNDFTDPNERSAAAINVLINSLPGAYQEILLYPRTE